MKSFDRPHYETFVKKGVPYAETVIEKTNSQRKELAAKYDAIHVYTHTHTHTHTHTNEMFVYILCL